MRARLLTCTKPWVWSSAPQKQNTVTQTCHPSTQEVEAVGSKIEGHLWLHCKFKAEWSLKVTGRSKLLRQMGILCVWNLLATPSPKTQAGEEDVSSGCRFEERRFYKTKLVSVPSSEAFGECQWTRAVEVWKLLGLGFHVLRGLCCTPRPSILESSR